MATIVLAAAGAAIGSGFGGAVLGLSGMVIGRAVGATVGRMIDQRLMGGGSQIIEGGRIERLRLTGASEGTPVAQVWGRVRLGGQVIWASDFLEDIRISGGGGGGKKPRQPTMREYSYSVSLAVALCEGPILGVGRIWADGQEIAPADLNLRVYTGQEDQLPDPLIDAVQGAGHAPAYRGVAYVVIEDLELGAYGNRVPQFSFEVIRATPDGSLTDHLRAVALMPGSGDFVLSTTPVYTTTDAGTSAAVPGWGLLGLGLTNAVEVPQNLNSPTGRVDLDASLDALTRELPNCESALLIVAWFGDDLRAGECRIEPKVEYSDRNAPAAPWSVAGRSAEETPQVARQDGRPVYGGTPSDASVLQAIAGLKSRGQKVVYYPFVLMEILQGNALPDPWSDADGQPHLPWRGRITTAKAPGESGSPDGTVQAADEVAAFFGTAQASDFTISGNVVSYAGPQDWRYRRFILHQAALCAAAGGVDAFCIGSEMRALTQIRGPGNSFPAVAALIALAAEVRAILGPDTKLTYAADWSEYFGYITENGDRFFHLDPLWADDNIDVIGIDNYMPLSDWRDGTDHLDAPWGDVHDLAYLKANIAGGEGYDWYYASDLDRKAQNRTPIVDASEWQEHWIWRTKDLAGWWGNDHHDRVGGVRSVQPTAWVPRSKPFWFTEYGCAAIDRGTNQPNVFTDPKSSESAVPHFSRGWRDDAIQMQYFRAMGEYWGDRAHNPVSELYDGPMVDMSRAHAWAWDARPYPWFPGNLALWEDGANWARGHWLTGRATGQPLDAVITAICAQAGVMDVDVSRVYGVVRGFAAPSTDSARAMLQSLMLAYGVEAAERDGKLIFAMRHARPLARLTGDDLVEGQGGDLTLVRAPEADLTGRIRLGYVEEGADFDMRLAEAAFPDDSAQRAAGSDLPLVMTAGEAQLIAQRWLAEARVARDTARFALPPSSALGAGDVVALDGTDGATGLWRIDRATLSDARAVEATRVEPGLYGWGDAAREAPLLTGYEAPAPVQALFLDLPLITGEEVAQAPWLAVTAQPWRGAVAVHRAGIGGAFELEAMIGAPARVGISETALPAAPAGLWDRGVALRVRMLAGELTSVAPADVLAGANLMAIGTGGAWELFQFAQAELVAPDTYELRLRLRGQQGTDGVMPTVWPAGAVVVMLDARLAQLGLPLDGLGLARSYRIGPASRPLSDPSHRDHEQVFAGVGLRPYRPAHLRATVQAGGDVALHWVRRTRRGGDGWGAAEVPLSEVAERYVLRVRDGAQVLREQVLDAPFWTYALAEQQADGAGAAFAIEVAQLSDIVGPGPFARLEVAL
ncbi:baseplate multidomain protein megatron [Roseinatronobacter alkalisoli]|uniref:Glycoside hydrolase/phage tail family protein n=1 Tax=Roseinatronobacter alkalisoli TaxID=3028235 RepID=A0ABT5TAB6_9RHOB|nr:glycoside hydrolase/phage tail family protein [Roseinatronobacter sp. HJB301]MDD7971341.1 glycoside hydrolase/phage tail family protein [Roseinatronobacter sp. HJB301]